MTMTMTRRMDELQVGDWFREPEMGSTGIILTRPVPLYAVGTTGRDGVFGNEEPGAPISEAPRHLWTCQVRWMAGETPDAFSHDTTVQVAFARDEVVELTTGKVCR